jgi:hypothetical protein
VLGEKRRNTLNSTYNLALEYFEIGRQMEGLLLMEKVTKIRSQTVGKKHPDTVEAVEALAWMKDEQHIINEDEAAPPDQERESAPAEPDNSRKLKRRAKLTRVRKNLKARSNTGRIEEIDDR